MSSRVSVPLVRRAGGTKSRTFVPSKRRSAQETASSIVPGSVSGVFPREVFPDRVDLAGFVLDEMRPTRLVVRVECCGARPDVLVVLVILVGVVRASGGGGADHRRTGAVVKQVVAHRPEDRTGESTVPGTADNHQLRLGRPLGEGPARISPRDGVCDGDVRERAHRGGEASGQQDPLVSLDLVQVEHVRDRTANGVVVRRPGVDGDHRRIDQVGVVERLPDRSRAELGVVDADDNGPVIGRRSGLSLPDRDGT